MMVGLPGSGKTHWAQDHMIQNPKKGYNLLSTNSILNCMRVRKSIMSVLLLTGKAIESHRCLLITPLFSLFSCRIGASWNQSQRADAAAGHSVRQSADQKSCNQEKELHPWSGSEECVCTVRGARTSATVFTLNMFLLSSSRPTFIHLPGDTRCSVSMVTGEKQWWCFHLMRCGRDVSYCAKSRRAPHFRKRLFSKPKVRPDHKCQDTLQLHNHEADVFIFLPVSSEFHAAGAGRACGWGDVCGAQLRRGL